MSKSGTLEVPNNPIVPFIEGDGTGPDIWRASQRVFDAAVEKAYGGKRASPGTRSTRGRRLSTSSANWLPDGTVEAYRKYLVGIKGPLTTPIGKGIRSLNVALRQMLDLYVCLRPVRWFKGVPSPVRDPLRRRHGDLPREHRGHLRGHRVGGRVAPRRRRSSPSSRGDEGEEDPLPRTSGIGIKPVSPRRHGAPGARRHRVRPQVQSARA
jgi:isocitrate dehydrogenase